MTTEFFERLESYFRKVGTVLRGEADAASIFPNPIDVGESRERVYAAALKQHLPADCRVFFGGFLFNHLGYESKQIDILVITGRSLQFNFFNPDGEGKSFASVEGCIGAISVKSRLTSAGLEEALVNLASIPTHPPLEQRVNPNYTIDNYDDWPYKIIYATDGISVENCRTTLLEFYRRNTDIPLHRRPNLIHVAGKYGLMRVETNVFEPPLVLARGEYGRLDKEPDVDCLLLAILQIERRLQSSSQILFDYDHIQTQFQQRRRDGNGKPR